MKATACAAALGLALCGCGGPAGSDSGDARGARAPRPVRGHGWRGLALTLLRDPFGLVFDGRGASVRGAAGALFLRDAAGAMVPVQAIEEAVAARAWLPSACAPPRGAPGWRCPSAGGVARVSLAAPAGAEVRGAGLRLASPSDEAIYGLMEAHRGRRRPERVPPGRERGLDRRGTSVPMEVRATLGLYTPFFQTSVDTVCSSRGPPSRVRPRGDRPAGDRARVRAPGARAPLRL